MVLNAKLLEVLACPKDKGSLLYIADESSLYNPRQRLRYSITDDVPILLVDRAESVNDSEHQRLNRKAANPRKNPAANGKGPAAKGKKSSHKKKAVTTPKSKKALATPKSKKARATPKSKKAVTSPKSKR